VENRPIFTGYDAYLFARYAEDFKRGEFNPGGTDTYRFVPDYASYPPAIPFVSWLSAKLSSLFNTYVENVTFYLIPILAVLALLPVILFFFFENLPLTALSISLLTALSYIYVIRTSINRLDTDALVIFQALALPVGAYLLLRAKKSKELLIGTTTLAFISTLSYWGYFHPGLIFSFFAVSLIVLLSEFKNQIVHLNLSFIFNKGFLIKLLLLIVAFNPYVLFVGFKSIVGRLEAYFFHFGKAIEGFPNVQISISELQHANLNAVIDVSVGSKAIAIAGLIGLIILFWKNYRLVLLFLPTLLLGLLTFKSGYRFAMFIAPVVGLGLGFLLDYLAKNFIKNEKLRYYSTVVLIGVVSLILILTNRKSFHFIPKPIMSSPVAEAFIRLGRNTPKNAWIWTWWDYGYAIQYYARRATFHDGGSQFSPKTYFVALSFTEPSEKRSANISKSVEVCGAKCIQKMLLDGKKPEEIKKLFEVGELVKDEKINHPIYYLFTPDLFGKYYWISYFGTWNFKTKKGKHHDINPLLCHSQRHKLICASSGQQLILDLDRMLLIAGRREIPIAILAIRSSTGLNIKRNSLYTFGPVVEIVNTAKGGFSVFITDIPTYRATFNKLYPLRWNEDKSFKLTEDNFPDFVVWRVK
jgi:dolichyl-diphosphooligosaccharide--protein glycosyltransferase